jgi:Protein of unknown function (DUF3043)
VKLLGRKKDNDALSDGVPDDATNDVSDDVVAGAAAAESGTARGTRTTAPKGRPTPKRNKAGKSNRRGPVAPAPMTAAEARARRKSLKTKLSREERRAQSAARRARSTERRDRMMAGEENYLLPRDQGPVRRLARDVVDARRNVLGLFMPSTLVLLFGAFAVPQLQFYMSPAMLVLMVVMALDAVLLGRKVGKVVDEKFPGNTESRWKLGLYAAGRASQLRRMRAPRPQVSRGSRVD